MADETKKTGHAKLIALAAAAGLVAGGLAVYVTGGLSGNNGAGDQMSPVAASGAACEANQALATALGDAAGGEVAAMMRADPLQDLSGLAFNGPDGAPMTLGDLGGRTLLVNLWATWCAPCRAEMPALDALEADMGGEDFEVVAINVDTGGDEKPKAFLGEIGISDLGYYRDSTLGVFNELKRRGLALGLPVTLLVGEDGCLLAHMNGPAEWASTDAKRLIEVALGAD